MVICDLLVYYKRRQSVEFHIKILTAEHLSIISRLTVGPSVMLRDPNRINLNIRINVYHYTYFVLKYIYRALVKLGV